MLFNGVDEVMANRIQGLEEEYNSYILMREREDKENAGNRYRNQLAVVSTKGAAVVVKTAIYNTRGQWHEHDTLLDSGALGSSYVSQQYHFHLFGTVLMSFEFLLKLGILPSRLSTYLPVYYYLPIYLCRRSVWLFVVLRVLVYPPFPG